ncbi:MAG: Zn-dependent exopeptidase M28 [Spirochaetia bacterium]|nr:Zn-dependent exopeptidase M28 [Spirochaetia bacterium]
MHPILGKLLPLSPNHSDHSIFIQYGRPAIEVSSKWFIDNMDNQEITHTPKDNHDIVDSNKVVELALAINSLVRKMV